MLEFSLLSTDFESSEFHLRVLAFQGLWKFKIQAPFLFEDIVCLI